MKTKLETKVLTNDDNEHTLEIIREDDEDVIEFWLDGEKVFSGDWSPNFGVVFSKALEMWKIEIE